MIQIFGAANMLLTRILLNRVDRKHDLLVRHLRKGCERELDWSEKV